LVGPRGAKHRRLSYHVMIAFHFACDHGDLEVATRLLAIVEFMLDRPPRERQRDAQSLVAAHERLWLLRHPDPPDD